MLLFRCISLLAAAIWLALPLPATAQEDFSITRLSRSIQGQEQLNADLHAGMSRMRQERASEAARLNAEEADPDGSSLTITVLRQARFEADTRRTRLGAMESQIGYFDDELKKLNSRIAELTSKVPAAPTTLEEYAAGVQLGLLQQLRDTTQQTLDLLHQGGTEISARLALLNNRVALLEGRIRLGALDESAELAGDPRAVALRDFVERTGRESVRLANAAGEIEPASSGEQLRKRVLELRADEAFLRSSLRAADIELLGIEKQLAYLSRIATESDTLPARLATEALDLLDRQNERLDRRMEALADVRRRLDDQRALLPPSTAASAAQVVMMRGMVDDVAGTVAGQEEATQRLTEDLQRTTKRLQARETAAEGEALMARDSLPSNAAAWMRVARNAGRVPGQLLQAFLRAAQEVEDRVAEAPSQQLATALGGMLLLLVAALLLRRLLHTRIVAPRADTALATPAVAIRDSILTLLPAAMFWLLVWVLQIGREAALLIGGVLAIWPVVAFALRLARQLLFRGAEDGLPVRAKFYRSLRWTMVVGGILAGLVILTSTLPLTPSLADLVHRSAMICVLLIALPGLQLRALILTMAGGRWQPGLAARLAARLSLLVPVVLAGAATVGLAGYLNLAWSVITHFLWFAMFGAALLLVMAVLVDARRALLRRLSEQVPDDAHFWTLNFVDPAFRLLQLVLIAATGWGLLGVYGWNTDTPVIRALQFVGRTPILWLGDSALSVQNVVLAVVLVALVFWVGGWTQQVSYNLALTRVRDLGIRQSLATFVQYVVVVLGLLLTLKVIGLDLTALTVFAASVGVGIGFGMQNVVSNFISGILLLAERPLRVMDIVTIGADTGEVTRIGIRSLTVRMFDRKELVIPNSAVIGSTFTNWTRTDDVLREVLTFKVSFRDDPTRVALRIEQVVQATRGVLAVPPAKATVWEFGDTGVTIRLQYYVQLRGPIGGLDTRADILRAVRDLFVAEGFSISTPSGDVALGIRHHVPPAALPAPS